ncbi:MAG: hypothetical protein ACP5EQ_00895 [Candidatus Cloacimonadia bacterium]
MTGRKGEMEKGRKGEMGKRREIQIMNPPVGGQVVECLIFNSKFNIKK